MPKTKRKHSAPHERPYVSDLELHDALQDKLTVRELNALEKQIRKAVEIACNQAVAASVEETYTRHWAVTMRVLIDRFGWEQGDLTQLWDAVMDYLQDYAEGRLNTKDMLNTLLHEDNITISWTAKDEMEVHDADI